MVFPNLTTSMIARRRAGSRLLAVLGLSALVFSLNGCEGGQAGDPNNRGPFELVLWPQL